MKKYLLAVLLFFLVPYCGEAAYAASTPHVVVSGEVWLLDTETSDRIFLLPETYYCKIDDLDESYYFVTFNGVKGKVEKTLVSTVGYHAQAVGTMQELKIDEEYSDFYSITIKGSMNSTSEDFQVPVASSFTFIGTYPTQEIWYYVKAGDKYGYIKAARTNQKELSIPAFVPETEAQPVTAEEPKTDKDKIIRIVIISSVCAVVLVLVILLFKPIKKTKKRKYYYEE